MKSASNWADRPHQPPGPDRVVKQHQAMASGIEVEKPPRKTIPPGMTGSETGRVYSPGWFSTKK
jgi:hypothetical protein